jgi:Bacterial Ig-like domain (group 3)/WxL domain surface cell wall-binding
MTIRPKSVIVGAAVLAVAAGLLAGSGGAALAAAPPWEPDASSIGGLTFYDAAGNQITGGNVNDAPFATYVLAGTAGRAGDNKATLFGYLPKNGVAIGAWTGEAISGSTTYPNASAPAPLGSSALPLVTQTSGDETIAQLAGDLPNTATDTYQGLYQLRLKTSGPNLPVGATYDSADILISGSTWSVVYPAIVATPTTTSLSTVPGSPQNAGTSVTLNATVSPAAAGTVQFKDGAANIGSPVTVSGGAASTSTSSLAVGSHTLTAVFTPSNSTLFAGSTSSGVPFVVSAIPAVPTTTGLSVNPSTAPAFTAVSLHADVTKTSDASALAAGAGTVKFLDGATVLGSAPLTASGADLSSSSFAVGTHQITAQFVPTDSAVFSGSTSDQVAFTATQPTSAPASQTVKVSLTSGALTITTPYSAANPFDLGNLVLDPSHALYKASAPFGDAADPGNGVSIVDTRAGDQPWTASVTTTDFVNGSSDVINGENLSFTDVQPGYVTNDAISPSNPIVTNDVTTAATPYAPGDPGSDGAKGNPHQFASATKGLGAVNVFGNLNLKAPASTKAGQYTATLTFTIA